MLSRQNGLAPRRVLSIIERGHEQRSGRYPKDARGDERCRAGGYYIAIEDLPTSPTQFNAPYQHGTDTWAADGDFNDFVYTVEGVVCQGGGQLCTVAGQQGICATGVTDCVNSNSTAAPACNQVFRPQPENATASTMIVTASLMTEAISAPPVNMLPRQLHCSLRNDRRVCLPKW